MTHDALPAMPVPDDVPVRRERSHTRSLDERERACLQALSSHSLGEDVELPYIQGRLDSAADELGLELLAVSIDRGETKLFVVAHELETWSERACESSTRLFLRDSDEGGPRGEYHKVALSWGSGQSGSLHVLGRLGRKLDAATHIQLEELAHELESILAEH